MYKRVLVLSFVLFAVVSSSSFEGLFRKCKKSSNNYGECLIQNAVVAVSKLAKAGNPSLKLNTLSPVEIDRVELQATPSLNVVLNNCKCVGFDTVQFDAIVLSDTHIKIDARMEKLMMTGQYDVKGQILVLPIQGVGDANFTLVNPVPKYTAKLETIEKNGHKYYKLKDDELTLETERVYYHLDNLFNGDKRLGKEMNKFLNEEWREVFEEVRGALNNIVKSIFTTYISGYFDAVPIQDLVD